MRPFTLQALTWTTIAAAVGSALWLAAAETAPPASAWRPIIAPPSFSGGGGRVIAVSLESNAARAPRRALHGVSGQR